jgi:hypothetical protein
VGGYGYSFLAFAIFTILCQAIVDFFPIDVACEIFNTLSCIDYVESFLFQKLAFTIYIQ